jgi:hypothetical protein
MTTRIDLRDNNNELLGHMDEVWPARVEGYDKDNHFVGHYDLIQDVTFDESNRTFGKGNLLSALICSRQTTPAPTICIWAKQDRRPL